MTNPQYPPAWQPPTDPDQPQYPPAYPPRQQSGPAPGGYPPPPAYPPNPVYPPQAQPYPGQSYPDQSYPGQSYSGQPYSGQSYPGQAQPGQAQPGQAQPGQAYPDQGYPPAGSSWPGHPSEPPTTPMASPSSYPTAPLPTAPLSTGGSFPSAGSYPSGGGYPPPGGAFPPGGSYPPAGPEPSVPSTPPKKGIGGRIAAILVPLVIAAVVAAFKFGGAAALSSLFDRGPSAPSNPFEGTAAESYPAGEAGIIVPTATAVDGFTEAEVAAALDTVRQALIAGRLDERMLLDHDRTTLRSLFSRLGAEDLDLMFEEKLGGIVATMIAPGYELTDDPIRVSGTMTFTGVVMDDIRWLEVHTQYVWVYPFTGELKTPGDHLVTLKDDLYWLFPAAEDVVPEDVGMYLDGRSTSYAHNIDCDLLDQDLIALGKPQFGIGPDVDPDDVMDPNSPVNLPDTC